MRINYDSKVDALYIRLGRGTYGKTRKITDSIMVDITRNGKVVGIEILDATENIEHFNPDQFRFSLSSEKISGRQVSS